MMDITSHSVSDLMSREGVRKQNQSKCVLHDQVCVRLFSVCFEWALSGFLATES